MENSELVKNFERIRDFMRQFYVYGFRSRSEMGLKSPRSYDNERRRIESWLGDYMSFRREEGGKQLFLSMDARSLARNPLYSAFQAKSFTDKDITLHFYVMDLLASGRELTLTELVDGIESEYLGHFPQAEVLDVSTLRKKLKEFAALGLVEVGRRGREYVYRRAEDRVDLAGWKNALDFYAEAAPLGVIGSFLRNRLPEGESMFRFKHHYLVHTLDSHILMALVECMGQRRWAELTLHRMVYRRERSRTVFPCRIHISDQTGRQYLLAYCREDGAFRFFRLDTVHKVTPGPEEPAPGAIREKLDRFSEKLWGVSLKAQPDILEMTVRAGPEEPFILQRLLREKRCGTVSAPEEGLYRYRSEVYDAQEMLPWLRTFTGRIESLTCSNEAVAERFRRDLEAMAAMYEEG